MSLRRWETQQTILAVLLALEIVIFSFSGSNFATSANAFEVLRHSVEIGLLAVALTLVIVTGGIDLSVGSLMGLSAVIFGKLYRDAGLPIPAAALLTIGLGAGAGWLNGSLITIFRIPPLIVTLGSYSLFRGLAEGLTGGVDNFTGFPSNFLYLGQGYIFGIVPAQAPIFILVAFGCWRLLHRMAIGRGLSAIGYAPEGARCAGVPVERRLVLVYLLSGTIASLAGLIYVARLGQAKADAGTGYELAAITAVALGGASIFGGRASVAGTLLGLFAITVLQTGLSLSDLPAELAGVLTGLLLLIAIGLDLWLSRPKTPAPSLDLSQAQHPVNAEDWNVKNSQVAALSAVILISALAMAVANYLALQGLRRDLVQASADAAARTSATVPSSSSSSPAAKSQGAGSGRRIVVAMMPKSKGNPYFIACRKGADEAAKELGVDLIWDGPTNPDPGEQNKIIDAWITRGVDVIAVAVENRAGISSVLRKARERGIKVVTWDSDAETDARELFVNQATPEGIGNTLMDHAGRILQGKGEFAIITASLTAANMIEWQKCIEARRAEKHSGIPKAEIRPCDDRQDKAFDEARTILNARPNVKLIMAICSPAVPGAAEAVKQSGRKDVQVIGLGLPNQNKEYVRAGITESVVLWNTMDLGYLTVHVAHGLATGSLKPDAQSIRAGRLDALEIQKDNVLLGQPFTFNKANIDQFDF